MKDSKKIPLHIKIFIALFLGIGTGYILNFMGGVNNPMINDHILPFLQFLGDFFIKAIKMVIVPLVFFSVTDAALSLGDIKRLRSVGLKTVVFFLGTSGLAATIGLILANIIQPGKGVTLGTAGNSVEVKELPGLYKTILDLLPNNPFQSLSSGDMMPIIVFSLLLGFAIIIMGEKGKPLASIINNLAEAMFNIIGLIISIIPYGVFGLMSVAMARYGTAIFGPVLKFILTDYLASAIVTVVVYSILLTVIGKVNPILFWKRAIQPWIIAFSTCTSSAALPVSMEVAPKLGISKEVSNFVLPLGATANMNGTCIYFGIIVLFASQLYGIDLSIQQQILLVVQATFLSVGCAATPQIGLVISITLLTQMGLPLEATALVAGIYRIIDQAHTATNSSGDLVAAVCIASMEGELDRETFNKLENV
ncbi:MAG: dicarboxylate/amino acid:cation symporter [Fusobacterium perfoetens]|uniref:dicarboxylate/amino acid:cation symporter n=1 Tax=Fusobacterium perfoetens TaxID=852 RepID=UPI0023F10AE1|nr:dicarboxylate/amino acid:cation symporter [Fusobacterium perfoetens]MCI6152643.1 dicarboxylate/amino acid:cation symporter [Fusobacterium perfoetens]MDY3237650.1 dicarboxylate/amino acid:cation symporter [Fusobacterium perfoetens]